MDLFDKLSDELLLAIFKYLNATDLYHLNLCCKHRFKAITSDEYLWRICDGRDPPNHHDKISFCKRNINKRTERIQLQAENRAECIVDERFIKTLLVEMKHLTVLALENQYLDGGQVTLSSFPRTLVELSLRKSFVTHYYQFFKHCSETLSNLHVLCLDQCHWFESHALMSVSKIDTLEILSLAFCKQLSDRDISYISVAGRYGFKSLKILDVRFTCLGDEIIKSFYTNGVLAELYFQSYRTKQQLMKGMQFDVDDLSEVAMRERFPNHSVVEQECENVTNPGVWYYTKTELNGCEYVPPSSVLYRRPYERCTCGHKSIDVGDDVRIHSDDVKVYQLKYKISTSIQPSSLHDIQAIEHMNQPDVTLGRQIAPHHHIVVTSIKRSLNEEESDSDEDDDGPAKRQRIEPHHRPYDVLLNIINDNNHFEQPHDFVLVGPHEAHKTKTSLACLSLRGYTHITNVSMENLRHLDLDVLDVTGTSVTKHGVVEFVKRSPNCRVVHESACRCQPYIYNNL